MAVKIRLTRIGAKKKPFYRIVAADSQAPVMGSFWRSWVPMILIRNRPRLRSSPSF
jgi:hypothetical protein